MEKACLMIQDMWIRKESVNLIHGLNVLSWEELQERGAWPSVSSTPVWVSKEDEAFAWSNRVSKSSPAQSFVTVSE